MPCRVKRNPTADARHGHQPLKARIAPTVGRQVEYPTVTLLGQVFPDDRTGHVEQPYMDRNAGFLPERMDPQAIACPLEVPGRQPAEIDIGESREAAEQKGIPDQLQGRRLGSEAYDAPQFRHGKVVPGHGFATQLVVGERITIHVSVFPRQHEDMFEGNHIDPGRILLAVAFQHHVTVKIRQEFAVYLFEMYVVAPIMLRNEPFKMTVYASVFIIGRLASGDSDHAEKFVVVPAEKVQQAVFSLIDSPIALLDHAGSYRDLFAKQHVVTMFNAIVDPVELFIDEQRLAAPSDGTSQTGIPKLERDGLAG